MITFLLIALAWLYFVGLLAAICIFQENIALARSANKMPAMAAALVAWPIYLPIMVLFGAWQMAHQTR